MAGGFLDLVNGAVGGVFRLLSRPLEAMPPIVSLSAISLLAGVGMLLVFRETSDQTALATTKQRMFADMLEIRLFNDDIPAILRAQWEILRGSLTYLRLSVAPMLWMIVPFVLLLGQLNSYYGYRGLEPGQSAILKVRLKAASEPDISLRAPVGMRIDSPLLWIPSEREAAWRIAAERPGEYDLRVRLDGAEYGKEVVVSPAVIRRSPVRSAKFFERVLYPVERRLTPAAPIESIEVMYPAARMSLLGWRTHWLVHFIVISLVVAFALKRPLRVTL